MNFLSKTFDLIANKFNFKLACLFVSFSLVTVISQIPLIHYLNEVLMIWGLILVFINVYNLVKSKRRLFLFEIFIYIFLLVTFLLTVFVNPNFQDFEVWIINLIILTVVFAIDTNAKTFRLKKELNLLSRFCIAFGFVFSLGSSIMIALGKTINISKVVNDIEIITTSIGLFENANLLGISAALSFIIGVYLFFSSSITADKYLLGLNSFVQLITLFLSKSFPGYLVLIAFALTFIFIYLKNKLVRISILSLPIIIFFSWVRISGDWVKNIYLKVTSENGIFATILILLILLSIFLLLTKKIENKYEIDKIKYTSILGLLFGVLMVNFVESNLLYMFSFISLLFWIYAGYLISIVTNFKRS